MRLIDANELIELLAGMQAVCHTHAELVGISKVWQQVKNMPTVDAEPHWIPVSEGLPEEGEAVLTQAKFKDDVKMAISTRVDFNYWTGWGTREIDIVAWMPLPKPYEVEND